MSDMMGVRIRSAMPADVEIWLELRNALWPSDDHPSEIAAYFDGKIEEPDEVLLTFRDGEPIALVELSIRYNVEGAPGVRAGYIEGLYVTPASRGFRLNRLLVNAAMAWAARQHCAAFASDRAGRVMRTSLASFTREA